MPAPRTKPGALLLTMLLIGACASNRPETPAAAAKAEATLDEYVPPAAPGGNADVEQLDASLEAYEQQLAQNESRLRAMGVRIASADPSPAEAAAQDPSRDSRFAPPPPAKSGDAPQERERQVETRGKAKKEATARKAPTPRPAAEPPRATATGGSTGGSTGGGTASSRAKPVDASVAEARAEDDDKDAGPGRCGELCELAQATCELEAKICDLAARHTGDPRYGEVCRRAGDDCRVASDACTVCSP